MYKQDLALNNLQWLICHKTQINQTNHVSFKTWTRFFLTVFFLFYKLEHFINDSGKF